MAKPNYSYEKRQRELEKKKKKEDKALKKAATPGQAGTDAQQEQPSSDQAPSTTGEAPAA